ncbi:phage protease [Komagataeibacter medellinensis]|nr:phage protease [Komagataeibacter medellinensis]
MMQLPQTGGAPDWIHLLPAGRFAGKDGRGPYTTPRNPAALMAASMRAAGGKLTLDENHSTDIAAKIGLPSPAMGWITELQPRADGVWGRVEWNATGHSAMDNRSYRGVSPVFDHDAQGTVTLIRRAALTNDPNLLDLHTLHHRQETRMDLAELARRLGLPETATQADVDRALDAARAASATSTSLHSSLGTLVGLGADAGTDAILAAVRASVEGGQANTQRMQAMETQLTELRQQGARRDAETAVDAAARDGRVISANLRTELVSLHAANPEMAMRIINGLPKLPQGQMVRHSNGDRSTTVDLNGADATAVAKMDAAFGVTEADIQQFGGSHGAV